MKIHIKGCETPNDTNGRLFSLSSLKSSIADNISYGDLSVNVYENCYLIRTGLGYRPFDSRLHPISQGFVKRKVLGDGFVNVGSRSQKKAYLKVKGGVDFSDLPKLFGSESFEISKGRQCDRVWYFFPPHAAFGHFITEGISRYWPFYSDDLCQSINGAELFNGFEDKIKSSSVVRSIRSICGVEEYFKERGMCSNGANEVIHVKSLFIPEPSVFLGGGYNYQAKLVWDAIKKNSYDLLAGSYLKGASKKLYLSRSKVSKRMCADEETKIEPLFSSLGFDIVHPQDYSLEEQICLISEAEIVAGLTGSALHLSQFMSEGAKLLAISPSNHIISDLVYVSKINKVEVCYFIFNPLESEGGDKYFMFSNEYDAGEFKKDLLAFLN